jgi:hypothetical protein
MSMDSLQLTILEKLYWHGYIGARHTDIENLKKGLPKHLRGDAEKAARRLIKDGWLIPKITSHGLHISINPVMIAGVKRLLGVS